MPVQEMDGKGLRQALNIQASIWIAGLHLLFQRPPDVFNLGIARLETIDDFHVARVEPRCLRDVPYQGLRQAQQQDGIRLLHFPTAGSACGNNVGVTVHAHSAMSDSTSFAFHQNGASDVDRDGDMLAGRNFHYSRRVCSQTDEQLVRNFR
jgi:hypothetical protein